jgi:acylphosphatase
MMLLTQRFLVSGKVQGVGFRAAARKQAKRLGVKGYAANLLDGRVEVLASGNSDQLQQLQDWLWQGPALARVENVEQQFCEQQNPTDFAVY